MSQVDTRAKICGMEEALRRVAAPVLVVGRFDPLLAAHGRRLEEIAAAAPERQLIAVVEPDDAGTLLPAQARAELLAGLLVVAAVAIRRDGDALPAGVPAITEIEADERRREELMRHVRSRHE
jgi:hypothetical protein